MPISSDISVIAWLFLFLSMLSGSEVLYTTDLEHHKSINCAVSINSNPFDNGHPSFPFVLLFLCQKLCGQRKENWWRWFTRLRFIDCKDLCWVLRGWPWIKIIILVENFGIICGSLLWSGLTMVLHWKTWLTIVEMKHQLVLVMSLKIVKNCWRSLKVTALTDFVVFTCHISLVNVNKFLLHFFSSFCFLPMFSSLWQIRF